VLAYERNVVQAFRWYRVFVRAPVREKREGDRLIRVGLTGSMGTGKATVARFFARLGARIIDADSIARQVIMRGTKTWRKLIEVFGQDIIGSNGHIDRRRLASIAFREMSNVRRLNSIVHPPVIEEIDRQLKRAGEEGSAVVIVNAPLLFEAGMEDTFDAIIVVTCPHEEQVRRCRERNGLSVEEIERRLLAQMPLEEKVKRSDYVIANNGSREDTEKQVAKIWNELIIKQEV
jgi:dephospho-CoA kinase